MKVIRYILVFEIDPIALMERVNELLTKGYMPQGAATVTHVDDEIIMYAQTMVLRVSSRRTRTKL